MTVRWSLPSTSIRDWRENWSSVNVWVCVMECGCSICWAEMRVTEEVLIRYRCKEDVLHRFAADSRLKNFATALWRNWTCVRACAVYSIHLKFAVVCLCVIIEYHSASYHLCDVLLLNKYCTEYSAVLKKLTSVQNSTVPQSSGHYCECCTIKSMHGGLRKNRLAFCEISDYTYIT